MLNADPVLALLSRALDAAALRQSVHATNIANVDTEGYRRLEVVYSAELQRLNAEGRRWTPSRRCSGRRPSRKWWSRPKPACGWTTEMAQMAENAVRYQALLGAIDRTLGNAALSRRATAGRADMGMFGILDISSAGMDVQQARLEAAASNIANARTTGENGAVYKPLTVVVRSAIAQEMGAAGTPIDTANLPLPIVPKSVDAGCRAQAGVRPRASGRR